MMNSCPFGSYSFPSRTKNPSPVLYAGRVATELAPVSEPVSVARPESEPSGTPTSGARLESRPPPASGSPGPLGPESLPAPGPDPASPLLLEQLTRKEHAARTRAPIAALVLLAELIETSTGLIRMSIAGMTSRSGGRCEPRLARSKSENHAARYPSRIID